MTQDETGLLGGRRDPELRCPVCGMNTSDPEHVAKWCEDALEGRSIAENDAIQQEHSDG